MKFLRNFRGRSAYKSQTSLRFLATATPACRTIRFAQALSNRRPLPEITKHPYGRFLISGGASWNRTNIVSLEGICPIR